MSKLSKKEAIYILKDLKSLCKEYGEISDDTNPITVIVYYRNGNSIHSSDIIDYKDIKVSNIAYMAYMDGYLCADTLNGDFDNCDDYWEIIDNKFSR